MSKRTPSEHQTWLRIRVAIAAYAYEFEDEPIMSDGEFDRLCYEVDLRISTTNKKMDEWFIAEFEPCTGQWIHDHPDLKGIKQKYELHYNK